LGYKTFDFLAMAVATALPVMASLFPLGDVFPRGMFDIAYLWFAFEGFANFKNFENWERSEQSAGLK